MKNFAKSYIDNLTTLLNNIDINIVSEILETIEQTQGIIYVIGNGGSAATASHMVNDLGIGLKRRNIKDFHLISLSDNTPVCSAIANDIGYENIFYTQLKDRIGENDLLIAISCSGNSHNITKAVQYAKTCNTKIIGLTGFDGGELQALCDINFHVQTQKNEYGLVEDMHMILNHMLYSYYTTK